MDREILRKYEAGIRRILERHGLKKFHLHFRRDGGTVFLFVAVRSPGDLPEDAVDEIEDVVGHRHQVVVFYIDPLQDMRQVVTETLEKLETSIRNI